MDHWWYLSDMSFKRLIIMAMTCCLIACSSETNSSFDDEITSISLSSIPESNSYTIYVNDEDVGTNTITYSDDSFLVSGYLSSQIQESITINSISTTITTYAKNLDSGNGYYIVTSSDGLTNNAYIPFPLKYLSQMTGYFGIMTDDLISVTMIGLHASYTNKNGHTFSDVAELASDNDLIKLFVNDDYFIIQKEDYRYSPTIQSLNL